MPCCAYLSENDYTKPTSDKEINQLLLEVRKATGEDYRVQESEFVGSGWFGFCKKREKFYIIYIETKFPEFQIINFYLPERKDEDFPSFGFSASAGHVAAFFYVILAGCHNKESKPVDQNSNHALGA